MTKLDKLSPHQLRLLQAAHFLRLMPKDYSSADLDENYDLRNFRHAVTRESIRAIASGEAAIIERNAKIDLLKELKRAKAKANTGANNSSSELSSSTDTE